MAINLGSVWNYINLVIRKEVNGDRLTVSQFNDLAKMSSLEYFSMMAERYEVHLRDTESMRRHKAEATLVLVSGQADYPTNYFRTTSLRMPTTNYPIDIVTDDELAQRYYDALAVPSTTYPVAQLLASHIKVYPTSVFSTAVLIYLTYPATPNFDYVVDSLTDEKVYMPVGSYWSGTTLYTSSGMGTTIQTNVAHPTATSPYTSTSVELDWNDEDILSVITIMLQKLGINMNDGTVVNYFAQKEQMDKVA